VLPEFSYVKHVEVEGNKDYFENEYINKTVRPREIGHRSDGLRICLGEDQVQKLADAKLFMVGAGAIGCELLKNYAMLGVGTTKGKG
jgi:tRNA A37 threonylcarbamoyladenosine dehydratase